MTCLMTLLIVNAFALIRLSYFLLLNDMLDAIIIFVIVNAFELTRLSYFLLLSDMLNAITIDPTKSCLLIKFAKTLLSSIQEECRIKH